MENEADRLKALLQKFDTAMLITHGGGGRMRARPMAIAKVEDNCDLWFVTGRETAKAHEIESNREVNVVCQDGGKICITISGRAQLVDDRRKLEEVWQESFKAWFPAGKNDPDICLIFVRGDEAEYWDQHGAKGIRYLFNVARARATGDRPEIAEGKQHGKVKLTAV